MKPDVKLYSTEVAGKTVTFETGHLAGQAGGAVTLQMGNAMIFASTTMSAQPALPASRALVRLMHSPRGSLSGSWFSGRTIRTPGMLFHSSTVPTSLLI